MYWFDEGQNHMWPRTKHSELTGTYLVDTLVPEPMATAEPLSLSVWMFASGQKRTLGSLGGYPPQTGC